MADPFDVFEMLEQDAVRWIGAATSLDAARAAIGKSDRGTTDTYLILDRTTGQKVVFKLTANGLVALGKEQSHGRSQGAAA